MLLRVAVIDERESYRERFVAALVSDYVGDLEVASFSSLSNFYDYQQQTKSTPVDVMLVSSTFGDEQLDGYRGATLIYFVNDKSIEQIYDRPAICRFQKLEFIYKALIDICLDRFDVATFHHESIEGTNVIPFFSASGGAGASTMAAACALAAAKRGLRAFYLNLEMYGNAGTYFTAEGMGNLSDILFAIEAKKRNVSTRIRSAVKRTHQGVSFLDSCTNAVDIAEMSADHVDQLVREIAASDKYDFIIVDLDYAHSHLAKVVMEISTRIVFVGNGTHTSNDKFTRIIEAMGGYGVRGSGCPDNLVLVYDNFDTATGTYLTGDTVPVLGAIGKVAHASATDLIDQLSNSAVFDELLNVDGA